MSEQGYIELIYKRLDGELSREEAVLLNTWLTQPENKTIESEIIKYWATEASLQEEVKVDVNRALEKVMGRIIKDKDTDILEHKKEGNVISLRWIAYAASLILISTLLYGLFSRSNQWITVEGTDTIVQVSLPDGSYAYIDAGSSLTFRKKFKGDNRLVKLKGRSYFEVEKNLEKPFIVEISDLNVQVLGTKFTVQHNKEISSVWVNEGKVKVSTRKDNLEIILTQNEKAIYGKTDNRLEKSIYTNISTPSWLQNQIQFNNSSYINVFQLLEQQFTISVENKDVLPSDCSFNGSFSKNISLDELMEHIKTSLNIEIKNDADGYFSIINASCK